MSTSKPNPLESAIQLILNQQTGIYKSAWQVSDLEAEADFAAWLEAKVKMAKKFKGVTVFQLHLVSVDRRADEHAVLDKQVFSSFTPESYPKNREDLVEMFRRAKGFEGATDVACILINLGDALQAVLN